MYNGLTFLTGDCKNSLASRYRESQLCRNILEELDHVNQSTSEGTNGQDKAAHYATPLLYQVSQLNSETD